MPFALALLAFFAWLLINGRAQQYIDYAMKGEDKRTLHMSLKTAGEL